MAEGRSERKSGNIEKMFLAALTSLSLSANIFGERKNPVSQWANNLVG